MSAPKIDSQTSETENICHICQQNYDTGTEPETPVTLKCGHTFGSVCISRWLHVVDRANKCPMCREKLFTSVGHPPRRAVLGARQDVLEDLVEFDDPPQRSDFDRRRRYETLTGHTNNHNSRIMEEELARRRQPQQPVTEAHDPDRFRPQRPGEDDHYFVRRRRQEMVTDMMFPRPRRPRHETTFTLGASWTQFASDPRPRLDTTTDVLNVPQGHAQNAISVHNGEEVQVNGHGLDVIVTTAMPHGIERVTVRGRQHQPANLEMVPPPRRGPAVRRNALSDIRQDARDGTSNRVQPLQPATPTAAIRDYPVARSSNHDTAPHQGDPPLVTATDGIRRFFAVYNPRPIITGDRAYPIARPSNHDTFRAAQPVPLTVQTPASDDPPAPAVQRDNNVETSNADAPADSDAVDTNVIIDCTLQDSSDSDSELSDCPADANTTASQPPSSPSRGGQQRPTVGQIRPASQSQAPNATATRSQQNPPAFAWYGLRRNPGPPDRY